MEATREGESTMATRRDGVSVVVPTLNEAPSIEEFVRRMARVLAGLSVPADIVVVDDASPDGTAEIVETLAVALPVPLRVLRRSGPRSLSLSVVDGARGAVHPVLAVLDADLSHDPDDLPRVIAPVLSGEVDLAVGSRYASGGAMARWPLGRRALSAVGTSIARVLTRVRDPLSGFFSVRREFLDGSAGDLRPRGYKILLEMLGGFPDLKVLEVPIRFRDRRTGRSKFGLRQGIEFLQQVLTLILTRLGRSARDGRRAGAAGASSGNQKVHLLENVR